MSSSGVIAAPFLGLCRRRRVEQDLLQLLVRQAFALVVVVVVVVVMVVMVVMAVVWVTVWTMVVLPRGPDVHDVEKKCRKAAEKHAGACNGAEAASCVVRISPARSPDAHCLD